MRLVNRGFGWCSAAVSGCSVDTAVFAEAAGNAARRAELRLAFREARVAASGFRGSGCAARGLGAAPGSSYLVRCSSWVRSASDTNSSMLPIVEAACEACMVGAMITFHGRAQI